MHLKITIILASFVKLNKLTKNVFLRTFQYYHLFKPLWTKKVRFCQWNNCDKMCAQEKIYPTMIYFYDRILNMRLNF